MADALFLAIAVLTIGSAIAALELRSLIYGSIALMGTLGGVAGFFAVSYTHLTLPTILLV